MMIELIVLMLAAISAIVGVAYSLWEIWRL